MPVRFSASGSWTATGGPSAGVYTVLFWYNLAADTNTYQEFVRFQPASGQNHFIETKIDGTSFTFSGGAGDVGNFVSALDTWYCVAVTVSGTSVTVRHGTSPTTMTSAAGTCVTLPAVANTIVGNGVNGRLANLKVYTAALTADEIALELAQYQPLRLDPVPRWWPFLIADQTDYAGGASFTGTGGTTEASTVAASNGPPIRWARSRGTRTKLSTPLAQTVSDTGIPSAEAFGAGALVAGPVGVTSAGIPTGEAFGTGQVTQTVASAGIPSGEVFGASALLIAGVVASTGIPSAEAFGAGSLTAGPVSVSGAGIGSAEVVSAGSRITLAIVSPGIVSAEAHGVSALLVAAVTVTAAGVASAEAFGAGTVVPGPVAVTTTGIASAEAFGTGRVGFTLYTLGIASAEAFGAAVLLPGPIAIFSPGIASAEAFGSSTVSITLDTSVRVIAAADRSTPTYEAWIMGRIPQQSGPPLLVEVDPLDWTALSWGSTLSEPQSASVTVGTPTITEVVAQRLRDPEHLPSELWIYRNGVLVFAGPLLGGEEGGDALTLTAGGLLTYTYGMYVLADKRFDQVDQHLIAAWLIDQWQATEHAHFGIDTSQVTPSGKLRDITYDRAEIHQVSRRIRELGGRLGGFDAEIDPTTRALQLHSPQKGTDRSTGEDAIVFDGPSIEGGRSGFSVAPGDLASDAFGSGSSAAGGPALWAESSNLNLRRSFGRWGVTGSWSDVSEQSTLDDHVAALRDSRDQPLRVPPKRVQVTPDADLDQWDVGDTVSYELSRLLRIGGAYRVRSRQVDVDEETSQETVSVEFV